MKYCFHLHIISIERIINPRSCFLGLIFPSNNSNYNKYSLQYHNIDIILISVNVRKNARHSGITRPSTNTFLFILYIIEIILLSKIIKF